MYSELRELGHKEKQQPRAKELFLKKETERVQGQERERHFAESVQSQKRLNQSEALI